MYTNINMFIYHYAALRGSWLLRLLPPLVIMGLGFVSALPSSSTGGGPPADASAAVDGGSSSCDGFATFLGWLSSVSSWGFPSSVSIFSSIYFLGRPRFLGGCGGISSEAPAPAASALSFEEEADDFFFVFPIWWWLSSAQLSPPKYIFQQIQACIQQSGSFDTKLSIRV